MTFLRQVDVGAGFAVVFSRHDTPLFIVLSLLLLALWAPPARSQEVDGSDLERQVIEQEERINKPSLEEQLKLRAAQQKAAQDPEVKAAREKRDQVIREFRAAVRASVIKIDPTLAPILERVAMKDPAQWDSTKSR